MEQVKTERGSSSTVAKIAVTFVAGVAVMLLLPWYGLDSDPPQCFSMFDYRVPCGAGLAFAAGAAVAGVVGFALWLTSRRR
jgi:hypothetical protein